MGEAAEAIPSIQILEAKVHMIQMPEVMGLMDHWIGVEHDRLHHVVNTGMHGIMEGHKNPDIIAILNSADILAPDGILAILIARVHGYRIKKQETGPDLLWRFSEIGHRKSYRYFFFGDTAETLGRLSGKISAEFPNVKIVGYNSPPFRQLTPEEDAAIVAEINEAGPDVLWVGLGMPRQEQWISEHRESLKVPVVVGAGASFKFIAGTVSRAPSLVCTLGFEWLWRLAQEPKRVWRRVLIDAPRFLVLVGLQLIGLKKFG